MKLLGRTENKIAKDKNGENVPHLEIAEVLLVYCNMSIMIVNEIQEFCIHLFQINHLGSLLEISPKNHIFLKTFNSKFQHIEVWFTD